MVEAAATTSDLLGSPTEDQQRLVDLVAEAFLMAGYEWPLFDYVEGVLDNVDKLQARS